MSPSIDDVGDILWAMDGLILVVEDDRSIREVTRLGLTDHGFDVITAVDGDDALARFRTDRPDAVVLDVMLPKRDGFEVLKTIRRDSMTPVVMLTAREGTTDVILGLELGADDYITKPFELPILVARLRSVLRRVRSDHPDEMIRLGSIVVDIAAHHVTGDHLAIDLTPTEFRLLVTLARRPGRVFSREALLEQVWEYPAIGDTRLVDVAVQRLRSKIEQDPSHPTLIETVRGFGYRAAG